ncbi:MAG: TolC family outer membrane protein [Pseudomonadota bacterium]
MRGLFAALAGAGMLLLTVAPGNAQTLNEAMATAYETNPTLRAQRAQLRATDEGLPEARAGWRPTVTAEGQAGVGTIDFGAGAKDTQPLAYGIYGNQPLYRGGRTSASTARANNLILAERARLASVEQTVLLQAATVYMDVARDSTVLDLTVRNEQVLARELNATQDRFRVGELTLTDVAQARARLAGAVAARIQAEGNLQASRAEYLRIIGRAAEAPQPPPPLQGLPASIGETLSFSDANNPDIVAAQHLEQAAGDDIRFARGEMLPTLSLNGQVEHREDIGSAGSESDSASVVAQLSIPLYQGGGPSARVRRAKQVAGQRRIQLDETRRAVRAQATSSWETLAVARARVTQFESQVEANKTALEGTREQARVGSRILLDVLNAEQELLDAQVSLEVAKRDSFVAGLQVLASIGHLTARDLSLDVEYYDESAYYSVVKGKLGGTDINE